MQKLFYRTFQATADIVTKFLDWREPELYVGPGEFERLPYIIDENSIQSLLIVTDQGIREAGLLDHFIKELDQSEINFEIYDQVEPNPTTDIAQEIAIHYNKIQGEALIGVGGGSVLDAVKGAGIAITQPEKPLRDFKGLLKVKETTPYTIAVPTTAGTGSEGTIVSTLSNPKGHEKYAIIDTALIPDLAVLDANLTKSLPPSVVAGTGMDALTHAIEAYIGHGNTDLTEKYGRKAVELISKNIEKAYSKNEDAQTREDMLRAAYYAGRAFTRAYVGNVHAISHGLTAWYGVPHGRTNATILPIILRSYGDTVHTRLAELAEVAGIGTTLDSDKAQAEAFIEWIECLNQRMDIDSYIPEIQAEDLDAIAEHAEAEANPLYPVPKIFLHDDFVNALRKIKEPTE